MTETPKNMIKPDHTIKPGYSQNNSFQVPQSLWVILTAFIENRQWKPQCLLRISKRSNKICDNVDKDVNVDVKKLGYVTWPSGTLAIDLRLY